MPPDNFVVLFSDTSLERDHLAVHGPFTTRYAANEYTRRLKVYPGIINIRIKKLVDPWLRPVQQ